MNFNIGKIVQAANMIKNPQQAIGVLLDKFGKNNPQMASTIRQAINSGKNPKAFIVEQARSGNITLDNLKQLKQYYGIAQKLGLSKKVPNSVWKDAENAIRNGSGAAVDKTPTQEPTSRRNAFDGF